MLALRGAVRRRFGARLAYALWLLVPVALLAVSIPAPVPDVAAVVEQPQATSDSTPSVRVGMATALRPLTNLDFEQAAIPPGALVAGWAAGAVAALLWLCWLQRRFLTSLGTLSRREDGIFVAASRSVGPVAIGLLRARIILPADFAQRYSAGEAALIVAHERAHVRRGDIRINGFVAALRCLYWFNPLVHRAASGFRFDQELACDAAVLARHPHSRRVYADAMLKTQLAVLGLPVGCHWQSSQSLKERVMMLKQPLPGRVRARLGAVVVCCVVAATGFAAWATQPLSVAAPARRGFVHQQGVAFAHVRVPKDKAAALEIAGPSMGPDERPDTSRVILDRRIDLRIAAADPAGPWELLVRGVDGAGGPEAEWDFLRSGELKAHGRQPIPAQGRTALMVTADMMPALPLIEFSRLPADHVVEYPANYHSSSPLTLEPDGSWLDDDSIFSYSDSYPVNGGHAVLLAHVGADGKVQRVEIERADPPGSLSLEAATHLVGRRVYLPQYVDGKPVASRMRVPVNYSRDVPERRPQIIASQASAPAVDTPAPPYPADALARKIGGGVTLHLLVGIDGKVKDVRVVGATPKGVFEAVSVEAARKWTLQPPMEGGKQVEGWVEVPITFDPKSSGNRTQPQSLIDLRMKLDVDGEQTTPRVVSRSGKAFQFAFGRGKDDPDALKIEGTATLLADGNIEVATSIRDGADVLGTPRLTVRQGVPGSIEIGNRQVGRRFRFEVVASADPASYADMVGLASATK